MMHQNRTIQISVGIFLLAVVLAMVVLAFRVSGLSMRTAGGMYHLRAEFDNIGGLKKESNVTVGGVRIGYVSKIYLNNQTFRAVVDMKISDRYRDLPVDSSASILTQGLLGSNFVGITPGFEEKIIKDGGVIETTHSALVLENLIGQLIYSNKGKSDSAPAEPQPQSPTEEPKEVS